MTIVVGRTMLFIVLLKFTTSSSYRTGFVIQMSFLSPHSGREQAELTGKRLAALGLKYDVLIHSSMARATETANIISKHLSGSAQIT